MKGRIVRIKLLDGTLISATVLYVNGSTLTVKGTDGFVYEVNADDLQGTHYVFWDSAFSR